MRKRYRTITMALASLLPLASCFAADIKLVKAVSDHFELYTTENEAAAKAALEHFETVRAYLLKATNAQDPFAAPVRIVGFKSFGEFSSYNIKRDPGAKAFSEAGPARATIVMSGLKKEMYEYGVREYATLLLDRTAPKLPYWLKLGFSELYCTLRVENGQLMLGASPARDFRSSTSPDFNMSTLISLQAGSHGNKGAADFYSSAPNPALGKQDSMGSIEASQTVDYPVLAWQLTHMLMFKKEYGSKFGAFVGALANGEDSVAVLGRIYGQSLAGLQQDLILYIKMASHIVVGLKFQLEKPVTPQVSQLSPGDSAPILAEIKAAK